MEKYMSQHVKHHIILENLKEYGYQVTCKLSSVIFTATALWDKYEKNFNAIVVILIQYIDKQGPTSSVNVAVIAQTWPAKIQKISPAHGTFKGKIELKSTREENNLMSRAQQQQLYELEHKVGLQ